MTRELRAGAARPRRRAAVRAATAVVLTTAALVLTACAAGPNTLSGAGPGVAGFWPGLWHGLISPVTFVVSLFTDDVTIYEVHNNGNWYDVGFVLGVAAVFSGPLSARRAAPAPARRRDRRRHRS